MFFKILKKDLKRNRSMNIILLLFIIVAAAFVASGLNNLVSVAGGTNYYLDKAGVGDFAIVVLEDKESLIEVLDDIDVIKSYRIDNGLTVDNDAAADTSGNKYYDASNYFYQSIDDTELKIFDTDNQEITEVAKGHVYIGGPFIKKNNINIGDEIVLTAGDKKITLIVDGKAKDAFLGSSHGGIIRFFMNDEDMTYLVTDNDGISKNAKNAIAYIDTDDVSALKAAMADVGGQSFSRNVINTFYVMDIIVAFLILILSACLIIVAFVILKFSLGFAIQNDFREIGVMKAIGLRDRKIKNLYMVKYVGLAIIGSIIGCMISFPFGRVLLKDVSENIMIGNTIGELLNVIGAVIVFGLIVGFAYICTGKLKKLTPTDAIREGESGERFGKKGGIRISKSHSKNARYLAINDILSSPRRYLNILISILICATFLLVISNTCSTLNSDICKDSFGAPADLYLKLPTSRWEKELDGIGQKYPEAKDLKEKLLYYFIDKGEELKEEGIPCKVGMEVSYSLKVEYEGKEYSYEITQGLNISSDQYAVLEGENPKNKNEIAITSLASENTGIKIGDTVTIRIGDNEDKYIVSGIYQSMANNNGDTIRFHEDVPVSFDHMLGSSHPRIFFEDTPSDAEFERRREVVKELFDAEEVMDAREFCVDTMGAYDMIKAVEMLLIVVTLVVVALITILMERTFVTDEKKQIAILKAIGFRDREVIKWHVFRFFILALISVFIAMAISVPVTNLTITPIFKIMGAVKVDYVYNFVSLFKYPLIIVAATSIIAMLTAGFTNKIKAVDTASIE